MKHLKYFSLLIIGFLSACEWPLIEIEDNPNDPLMAETQINLVYNNVQLEFNNVYHHFHNISDGLVRMTELGTFTYEEALTPEVSNALWESVYVELLPDIEQIRLFGEAYGYDYHVGTALILKSYILTTLVDYFKDVPADSALKGTNNLYPENEEGHAVYQKAEQYLDDAITLLTNPNGPKPAYDLYYEGDHKKWVSLAKTLKMRIYANTRKVDPDAQRKFWRIVEKGDFIDRPEEDFQFSYGENRIEPNSRHPFYNAAYESTDLFPSMSNYYMWQLFDDPRLSFYFYRQGRKTYDWDKELFVCYYSEIPDPAYTPSHFLEIDANMPYCTLPNGYHGRDHGNGLPSPEDGKIKTVYGLYPAGGKWDNYSTKSVQNNGTEGGFGQGISPIWMSSYSHFIISEMAIESNELSTSRAFFKSGIEKSISKVMGFKPLIPKKDLKYYPYFSNMDEFLQTAQEWFMPTQVSIYEHINILLEEFDISADKLDLILSQYYIALWGNSIEAYNMYRRTGKPNNMMPGLELTIGEFPRSILYPPTHLSSHGMIQQKSLSDRVFWDDGSAVCR